MQCLLSEYFLQLLINSFEDYKHDSATCNKKAATIMNATANRKESIYYSWKVCILMCTLLLYPDALCDRHRYVTQEMCCRWVSISKIGCSVSIFVSACSKCDVKPESHGEQLWLVSYVTCLSFIHLKFTETRTRT